MYKYVEGSIIWWQGGYSVWIVIRLCRLETGNRVQSWYIESPLQQYLPQVNCILYLQREDQVL